MQPNILYFIQLRTLTALPEWVLSQTEAMVCYVLVKCGWERFLDAAFTFWMRPLLAKQEVNSLTSTVLTWPSRLLNLEKWAGKKHVQQS